MQFLKDLDGTQLLILLIVVVIGFFIALKILKEVLLALTPILPYLLIGGFLVLLTFAVFVSTYVFMGLILVGGVIAFFRFLFLPSEEQKKDKSKIDKPKI